MTGCIAVLNAGSSSIKFALYEAGRDGALLFRGQVENIGLAAHLAAADAAGAVVAERRWGKGELDHRGATAEILKLGRELLAGRPVLAFGHRVVHGGTEFAAPVRVDANVMAALAKLVPLAPLHQPHNLAPIEAIAARRADMPQIACFDTAFHRSQPPLAQEFALPRELTAAGVRRYGFHGLSYDFIVSRLGEIDPALAQSRLVIAHLGNGASLCAVAQGRSVASTMGFTAVDGLMMGTRCGALDPGVLLYLMQERGLDARGHRGPDLPPVRPARRVRHLLRHAHPAPVQSARGGRGDRPVRLPHRARDRLARGRPGRPRRPRLHRRHRRARRGDPGGGRRRLRLAGIEARCRAQYAGQRADQCRLARRSPSGSYRPTRNA